MTTIAKRIIDDTKTAEMLHAICGSLDAGTHDRISTNAAINAALSPLFNPMMHPEDLDHLIFEARKDLNR